MKLVKFIVVFAVACCFLMTARSSHAGWKGSWYLRGATECKEIKLDRKGRTEMGIYPKAIVEKKDDGNYLTVESMGKKYSYRMIDIDKTDFDLDLVSVGPNAPLPKGQPEGAFTGMFKQMVDCQTTLAGITETSEKK